jgi:hypothetical protein
MFTAIALATAATSEKKNNETTTVDKLFTAADVNLLNDRVLSGLTVFQEEFFSDSREHSRNS